MLNFGCKKNPTEPVDTLALSLEDVSCTEVWVEITNSNFQNPSSLSLFVDDKLNQTITLVGSDTLLYVDSLLPNQSYKIKATLATNNQQLTTNEVVTTTMDTTSHNITWQTFTFGGGSSSTLYDVAIINGNNIWAVGEIYMNDSLGNPDPHAYNTVHWDGNKWTLYRIKFYTICGQSSLTPYPAKAIYAFSENDIWISMDGDQVARINGTTQISTQCLPWSFSINKMWGTSSSDLYAVGNSGNIAHYNGKTWQKIESGTDLNFYNIWGNYNLQNDKAEVISVGSVVGTFSGSVIMKIDKQNSVPISSQEITGNLTSLWFESNRAYYVGASNKIFFKHKLSDPLWSTCSGITSYSKTSITGNSINDLFVAASYGDIVHFNGYSWFSYYNQTKLAQGVYGTIKLKDNTVVSVDRQATRLSLLLVNEINRTTISVFIFPNPVRD